MDDLVQVRDFYEYLIVTFVKELNKLHLDILNPYPRVEVGLAAKGMKSWRAIAVLFFGGFQEDAEIVLRSLVDVVLDMRFISLDPKERAERFIDYREIHRLRFLRRGKELGIVTDEKEIERLEKSIMNDAADVLKRRPEWDGNLPKSWTSEDTATKARQVGEPMLYLTFMTGSTHTHPNVVGLENYFAQGEKSVEVLAGPRTPKDVRSSSMLACSSIALSIMQMTSSTSSLMRGASAHATRSKT